MQLQLTLSAQDLSGGGLLFNRKPDPFAVVTWMGQEQEDGGGTTTVLGQTEVCHDTKSPDWTKAIILPDCYSLGKPMYLIVSIFDKKKSLCSCVLEVGSILGAPGSVLAKELKNNGGLLIAHVEPVSQTGTLEFQWRGVDLEVGPCYFEIQRLRQSKTPRWGAVYRSALSSKTAIWDKCYLPAFSVNEKFRVAFYKNKKTDYFGQVMLTIQDILSMVNGTAMSESPDLTKSFAITSKGVSVGKLVVAEAQLVGVPVELQDAAKVPEEIADAEEIAVADSDDDDDDDEEEIVVHKIPPIKPTFVNYVAGGCSLKVIVAIDATASNGDPRQEASLHHFKNEGRNEYEDAVHDICSILAKYDSDQKYTVLGFGAKREGSVSHCFPLGGESAEADGVDGILSTYRDAFRSGIVMSSPRDFSHVIKKAATTAKSELEKSQSYCILLLFTNGVPADTQKTLAALRDADDAPLSVVIVGVGDGDFEGMNVLEKHHDESHPNLRDNTRFVPFESLKDNPDRLTAAALDHIPDQLVAYFVSKEIHPEPKQETDEILVQPYSEVDDIEVPIQIAENGQAKVDSEADAPEKIKARLRRARQHNRMLRRKMQQNQQRVNRMQRRIDNQARRLARQAEKMKKVKKDAA